MTGSLQMALSAERPEPQRLEARCTSPHTLPLHLPPTRWSATAPGVAVGCLCGWGAAHQAGVALAMGDDVSFSVTPLSDEARHLQLAVAILCGGMKRTCDVYDALTGARVASLSSAERMTAIPSRNAVHRDGRAVACATNSGRIHIYQA